MSVEGELALFSRRFGLFFERHETKRNRSVLFGLY